MTHKTDTATPGGDAYHYRSVRPLSTFAFAVLAALGALGLVGLAQTALVAAVQDDVIAEPPDLRKVLVTVENRTGIDIPGTPDDAASAEQPSVAVAESGSE